jgi:hypothetical protein
MVIAVFLMECTTACADECLGRASTHSVGGQPAGIA